MPDVYAVFEGGGVKGIAHVGAYARVQLENLKLQGFAGSSAGAIVAALAAAGYNAVDPGQVRSTLDRLVADEDLENWPGEMVQIMRTLSYLDFLDGKDELTLVELKQARDWFESSGSFLTKKKAWFRKTRLAFSAWSHSRLLNKLFGRLVTQRGLYGTRSFLRWMHEILNQKAPRDPQGRVTFGSLRQNNVLLKVIATDLVYRTYLEFNPVNYAGVEVANAVQSSMSIPFFFEPYPHGSSFLVDGGLVSNFPAWVFEAELSAGNAVVLGFRLVPDRKPAYSVTTFGEYARELFHTALEGPSFLQTRGIPGLIAIEIPIDPNISATKFDLNEDEQKELFFAGWQQADVELSKNANRVKLGLPPI